MLVKLFEDLVIVMVLSSPISVEPDIAMEEDLGISVNAKAVLLLSEILGTIWPVCVFKAAVIAPTAIVFLPSDPCVTVVEPDAIVQDEFAFMDFWDCEV